MSSTEDIMMQVVAIEKEIALYEKCIEDAFTEMEEDMVTWNDKRQEAVKCEAKKCMKSLGTLDQVCFNQILNFVLNCWEH